MYVYSPWQLNTCVIQVVIFAQDNSKFTKFLIESEEAFDRYFKQASYNQQPIEKLYTLEDVYSQITLIVNSVSFINSSLHVYSYSYSCYTCT